MAQLKSMSRDIVTPTGIGSFMHVLEPEENLNGAKEYSLDLLIPKSDGKKLLPMKDLYTKMCKAVWGREFLEERPFSTKQRGNPKLAIIKDGDARYSKAAPDKRDTYAAYKGHYYIKIGLLAAKGKPWVLDRDRVEIFDGAGIQSGDFVRVLMEMSTYRSKKYGAMFSLKLKGVQKMRDGDPLSTGSGSIDPDAVQAAFADAADEDFDYSGEGAEFDDTSATESGDDWDDAWDDEVPF